MGHGGPDWGTAGPIGTIFTIEDLGELAARLGSIDTFDRRGNIIAFEDFQGALSRLKLSTTGDRGTIEQSSLYSRTPDFSLKMQAGGNDADRATLQMCVPFPVLSKLGFEFSFSTAQTGLLVGFAIYAYGRFGTYLTQLEWLANTKKIKYWDADGAPVELPDTFDWSPLEERFNTVKLVIDLINAKYVRLLWNDKEVDMSNLGFWYSPIPEIAPYAEYKIYVVNTTLLDRIIYVDDIILTQNEP